MVRTVFQIAVHFFAGVEDILRIKYFFDLREQCQDLRTIHFLQVRRADQTIVMLRRYGTVVLEYEPIYFFRDLRDQCANTRVLQVH